jgi:hypothetical protein
MEHDENESYKRKIFFDNQINLKLCLNHADMNKIDSYTYKSFKDFGFKIIIFFNLSTLFINLFTKHKMNGDDYFAII